LNIDSPRWRVHKRRSWKTYLVSSAWKPADAFSRDVIRYHPAQNLTAAGDKDRAFEIACRISDPDVLTLMLADKRFDGVVADENPTSRVNKAAADLLQTTKPTNRAAMMKRWVSHRRWEWEGVYTGRILSRRF
jgi:hypothetical protein